MTHEKPQKPIPPENYKNVEKKTIKIDWKQLRGSIVLILFGSIPLIPIFNEENISNITHGFFALVGTALGLLGLYNAATSFHKYYTIKSIKKSSREINQDTIAYNLSIKLYDQKLEEYNTAVTNKENKVQNSTQIDDNIQSEKKVSNTSPLGIYGLHPIEDVRARRPDRINNYEIVTIERFYWNRHSLRRDAYIIIKSSTNLFAKIELYGWLITESKVYEPGKQFAVLRRGLERFEWHPTVNACHILDKPTLESTNKSPTHAIYTSPKFKPNRHLFKDAIHIHRITKLYHFTDRSNLNSIKANNGLYSWHFCKNNSITISKPGGSLLSWQLDQQKGLHNYVRVSFVPDHPMMYVAKSDGRITDPIILEINPEVIYLSGTKFATQNAAKSGVVADGSLERFKSINFSLFSKRYFDLAPEIKPFYQAEVLILEKIPLEYIYNINSF